MEKILILGGTNFIGRNLTEQLLQLNKFDITLFNRGKTNTHLFPNTNKIHGDRRSDDINKIAQENWDYVIDLSCYYPSSLVSIFKRLNPSLKRYIFISSCSVYDNSIHTNEFKDENSPVLSCNQEEAIDTTPQTYGKRKVACEQQVIDSGFRYSILRPALVYGQYDHTDRFYYWLYQTKFQNDILYPNEGLNKLSLTYINDLITSILRTLNTALDSDIYNIISYPEFSLKQLIDIASSLLNTNPKRHKVDNNFFAQHNLSQWKDIPLWIDADFFTFSNTKMLNQLQIQPIDFKQTVQATIDYYNKRGWDIPIYGIKDTLKVELIKQLNDYNYE